MRVLGEVCEDRNNGFNFLRLIAALGILAAHCLLVIPVARISETVGNFHFAFDTLLAVFFVFSGFLITASLERHQGLVRYFTARVLRIFPGLVVVGIMLALVMGPYTTSLSLFEYLNDPQAWRFIFSFGVLLDANATLPGVFADHPAAHAVDLSIWTLRYEIVIYIAFPFLFRLMMTRSEMLKAIVFSTVLLAAIGWELFVDTNTVGDSVQNLFHFGVSFMLGSALWTYRKFVPNSGAFVLMLWLGFLVSHMMGFGAFPAVAAAGYSFIWFAFAGFKPLLSYNRFGDYSYGIYILHFPIAQLVYAENPTMTAPLLAAMTLLFTIPLAMLLWTTVEKTALSQVRGVDQTLTSLLARSYRAQPGLSAAE